MTVVCADCGHKGKFLNIAALKLAGWLPHPWREVWLCPDCAEFPEIKGI